MNFACRYPEHIRIILLVKNGLCLGIVKVKSLLLSFYEKEGKHCVNLKCDPLRADFLRRIYSWVTPGYHMNKVHWNTIWLNNADEDEVRSMILHSYLLTARNRQKKGRKKGET